MGFENINNINKAEAEEEKKENSLETIETEKNPESMENIKEFVDEEKELFTEDNIEGDKETKESRAKTFFKKAIIGTTIMVSLWSMGKIDSSKVEASEGNTQQEQQDSPRRGIESLLAMLNRMEPVLSQTLEMQSEVVEDTIDYASISPHLEDVQKSIDGFHNVKNALEFDEEGEIERIKNAGKLEILINTADDMVQKFDQMNDSQKDAFEKEGMTIDDIKEVKGILEKHLTE